MDNSTVFAALVNGQARAAFEVNIKGSNVYINYFNKAGAKTSHTSYHASGQRHLKKNGDYVYWTGGTSGNWEPMKFFESPLGKVQDREHVAAIGWMINSLGDVLPIAKGGSSQLIPVPESDKPGIVVFEISVVGAGAQERDKVHGFPVFWRHRVSSGIQVEVEAVWLEEGAYTDEKVVTR